MTADSAPRKSSATPESAPDITPRKTSATPESTPALTHGLKAQVEVESVEETPAPKPKPILKVVADVEITETPEPQKLKPVATVEVEERKEPELPERRASYVAPKAATKKDVDLLYELDEQKLLELREVQFFYYKCYKIPCYN